MDSLPASEPATCIIPDGSPDLDIPCGELLRRHLWQEDIHTRRALAVTGVDKVKQQLLEELRDLYLAEPKVVCCN